MKVLIVIFLLVMMGCATAVKKGDKIEFYGWGKAKWPDKTEIESDSPLKLPDITYDK